MNLEELKLDIEKQTGVPATLLKGETAEENIAQAKALLAYKREADAERPRTAAEQFSDWMNARNGIEQPDTAGQALADIEERARIEAGGYPITRDAGEAHYTPQADPKTAFAEWASSKLAFNPFKNDGWTRLY